jgi:hypothetical protein
MAGGSARGRMVGAIGRPCAFQKMSFMNLFIGSGSEKQDWLEKL